MFYRQRHDALALNSSVYCVLLQAEAQKRAEEEVGIEQADSPARHGNTTNMSGLMTQVTV